MYRILYEKAVGSDGMRGFTDGRLLIFEQMMKQKPDPDNRSEDTMCVGCPFHRRDFEYRYCLYTECPYIKGLKTFREEAYEYGGE